tara:strand:- start:20 stop:292 length:273 start_codon:yes stop_codon:yes gene_type:complete
MLNTLSLATEGHLSGGKYSSLSIAVGGMLFSEKTIPSSLDVTAGFLINSYSSVFDVALHDSTFHSSDKVAFKDDTFSTQYSDENIKVKFN